MIVAGDFSDSDRIHSTGRTATTRTTNRRIGRTLPPLGGLDHLPRRRPVERRLELVLRRNATITALHLLDCCDTIEVGELASIGGWFTQVMTHAADLEAGRQSTAPVLIGERSLIGTRAVIVPGVEIADRVFVGAGSVVTRSLPKSAALYAGVPAVFKRDIDPAAGYFTRPGGRVP